MEAAENNHLLEATGVFRSFETSEGTLEVLRGVDLAINQGEMAAVVGESGVGKSTLLHILGGLDRPNKGTVVLKGERLLDKSETDLAHFRNSNLGFVFQYHYLLEDFSALENVMIPALIAGVSRQEAAVKAEHLLVDVGLENRMHHRPRQLSGGEQQRVAVARALVNEPGMVIADEPSGNLDIKTGEKLHRLLAQLNNSRGTTFLIATHNIDLAKSCRIIVRLVNGQVGEVIQN
ncbi:outer membrane-specific lipoprotein transporter subunit; ATP-binding component of ABC superfamily [Candidatus Zixiibacteriota bacterium]|nr:outer membrane-specific lipoprotein transporter subunit; ATP-binding component of ABC superfamily [candidate division Zixibacteria bacterium]